MPDIPDDVGLVTLHNGGADHEGCCICCGTRRGWIWNRWGGAGRFGDQPIMENGVVPDDHIDGDTCYCGCCPCYPSGPLKFSILSGRTSDGVNERPLDNPEGWEFTLGKSSSECKYHAEEDIRNQAWLPHWFCGSTEGDNFCGPYTENIEFKDGAGVAKCPNAKQKRGYPEAWGYTGKICAGTFTTPDCPGYSYPEACGGMGIKSSLCCCKNAMTSNWGGQGNERDFGDDPECPPTPLYDTRGGGNWPVWQRCPWEHIWFRDIQNEDCMIDCFVFTISPDWDAYTHTYQIAVEDETRNGYWKLEGKTVGTSCSKCVYEQGQCGVGWNANAFYPGTPMQGWLNVPIGLPASNEGQHTIISGTCQSKSDDQKFAIMVLGGFTMDCDCATGVTHQHTNWPNSQCLEASCGPGCEGDVCEWWNENAQGYDGNADPPEMVDLADECQPCNRGLHLSPGWPVTPTLSWDDTPFWPEWLWPHCNSAKTDGDWHYNDGNCANGDDPLECAADMCIFEWDGAQYVLQFTSCAAGCGCPDPPGWFIGPGLELEMLCEGPPNPPGEGTCLDPGLHPEWCGDIKCRECEGKCASPCTSKWTTNVWYTGIIEEA